MLERGIEIDYVGGTSIGSVMAALTPINPAIPGLPGKNSRWHCWRPECRERFGDYRTVRIDGNRLVAECHSAAYAIDFSLRVEIWTNWP